MSLSVWLAFVISAAAGSVLRYLVSLFVQERALSQRPWGTFVVNVVGCLMAGVVAGMVLHHDLSSEVARVGSIGFLGSFTTFSTLAYETVRLAERDEWGTASLNLVGSLLAGGLAALLGIGVVTLW